MMKQHNSKQSRTRIAASLGILALAVLAACGENGFLPPSESNRPEIDALAMGADSATMVGDTIAEGDTLWITLDASGTRAIDRARLRFTGAIVDDTTFTLEQAAKEVEGLIFVLIPPHTGPDSMLYLDLTVLDVADIESDVVRDSVFLDDASAPLVQSEVTPAVVGTGEDLTIGVTSLDARGIGTVGYTVIDGGTGTAVGSAEVAVPTGTLAYDTTFTFTIPQLDPTTLRVVAHSVDHKGLRGASDTVRISLEDKLGPDLTILETFPDSTIPLGDSVQIRVQAVDPSGIRRLIFIGQAARGDTLLGTDVIVTRFDQFTIDFPRPGTDTLPETVIRAPFLYTADDSTSEAVTMIVLAEDGFGNVSEVTRSMFVGGPDVSLVYPTGDVAFGVNQTFDARIRISDSAGIDSAKVFLEGGLTQTFDLGLPARTDTPFVVTQTITLPATEAEITLHARAWNRAGVGGQTRDILIEVLQAPPEDISAPVVSVAAEILVPDASKPRMEAKDILRITVTARDEGSAGLARIGFKAIATRAGGEFIITESSTYASSHSLETHEFAVPLDSLYALFGVTSPAALDSLMPDEVDLRIHGFAADAGGALSCSVGIEEQRTCNPTEYTATSVHEAADTSGLLLEITAVRGHTVLLDNQDALIADLAVDTASDRLFLSNITHNLVELLQLDDDPDAITFLDPVQVGSRPWGIFIGERAVSATEPADILSLVSPGDTVPTLIVGNSGGTNISLVHLDANAANVQEVDVVRLRTANTMLFEIEESSDEFGAIRFLLNAPAHDFSDRPQFLAQDSLLRVVYSTEPTDAAETSTVRFIMADPDPTSATDQPEVRLLLTGDMVNPDAETILSLANIDSVQVLAMTGSSDLVRVFSHQPGYPDSLIFNPTFEDQVGDAVSYVVSVIDSVMLARGVPEQAPMYYPFFARGEWDLAAIGMSDTTFISASGDRGKIAIGEGATQEPGRIILWHADQSYDLSDFAQIQDLINNASERVLGVGLNQDGSLGVARGADATYFFTSDLRLQGIYQNTSQGGAGATFHPDHDSPFDGGHTDTGGAGVAFTGTPTHSIDVVNTFHFNLVSELHIRDNVVGPLRAGPPLDSDNGGQGAACTLGDDCIIAKLYGITDAGGVVIVNVRRRDVPTP